jgi:hypothetical protein
MMDQREPTLEDLLSEPIIQQVMVSDGVRADDVRYLMQTAQARPSHDTDEDASLFTQPMHYLQSGISGRIASPA